MARPKLKSNQKAQPAAAGQSKSKMAAGGNATGKARSVVAAPIRHVDEDTKLLHNMGYAQELARRMSGFSNFAISFSIICILAGGITAFGAGFSAMGGASIGIGWLVGGLFAMIVALSMGQIASAYPTAGGLYHWGSILGGRAWGWSTAWFNLLGLIFVVASVDVGVYNLWLNRNSGSGG